MADTKRIIIEDRRSSAVPQDGTQPLVLPQEDGIIPVQQIPTDDRKTASIARQQALALGVTAYVGSKAVGFASSRVEMLTGSSAKQQAVNLAGKAIGYAIGYKAGFWIGTANVAIDLGTTAFDYNKKREFERIQETELQRRLNLSSFNGSR